MSGQPNQPSEPGQSSQPGKPAVYKRQQTFAEAGETLVKDMAEKVDKIYDTTKNMGQQWNFPDLKTGQQSFYIILWAQVMPGKIEEVDMRQHLVKKELIKLAHEGSGHSKEIKNCK